MDGKGSAGPARPCPGQRRPVPSKHGRGTPSTTQVIVLETVVVGVSPEVRVFHNWEEVCVCVRVCVHVCVSVEGPPVVGQWLCLPWSTRLRGKG